MRLRGRLTAVLGVLLVLGLLVSGVLIYTSVRSYLYGKLDEQLEVAQDQSYHYLLYVHRHPASTLRIPLERGLSNRVSPDVFVVVLTPGRQVLVQRPSGSVTQPDPTPVVPFRIPVEGVPPHHVFGRKAGAYRAGSSSVDLRSRGPQETTYRAQAVMVPQGILVVAIPLDPTAATLQSLVRVELLASVAVVVVGCALAFWLVRRELRALEEMTQIAGAIAGGQLERRVPAGDGRSEVGRLARALNGMLSQIQAAFDQKSTSEARLRQFVADASHELRTPLTSIRGYTELLRKGAFADEEARRRALARVESEATRMGMLVDDLLLLARLDRGRPLELVPVDLARIGAEVVEDARAVDRQRCINFVSPGPVLVVGDANRLREVVHNLVRNAISHTPPEAGVTVEVARQGGRGFCRVVDAGPGMATEQAAHIFDRFYRGDVARTGGGTGLGLAIVQAITRALGGSATVQSVPGRGSTFTVDLPLAQGQEVWSQPAAPGGPAPGALAPGSSPSSAGR